MAQFKEKYGNASAIYTEDQLADMYLKGEYVEFEDEIGERLQDMFDFWDMYEGLVNPKRQKKLLDEIKCYIADTIYEKIYFDESDEYECVEDE